MDLSSDQVWTVALADHIDWFLGLWHQYRMPAVFGIAAVLLAARLFLRPNRSKTPSSASIPPSPTNTAAIDKVLPEIADLNRDSVRQSIPASQAPKQSVAKGPKVITGRKPVRTSSPESQKHTSFSIQPIIFFCSLTGTTEKLAGEVQGSLERFAERVGERILKPQLHDISYVEFDDYFINGPPKQKSFENIKHVYCILIPSYDIDTILNTFISNLEEIHHDFRINTAPLSTLLGYTVFGIGDKEGWPTEAQGFCSKAIEVDKWMAKLTGRKRFYPVGTGDVKGPLMESLSEWLTGIKGGLMDISESGSLGEGVPGSGAPVESDEEEFEEEFPDPKPKKRQKVSDISDLEDVRGPSSDASPRELPIDFTTYSKTASPTPKEMVPKSSPTYTSLTKQGYTIVGSHSGVKICRWTKSALRGRGSCYKNSFYGIKSHLCMETTPSLSCSNKCVFCWRHGTNPVSTTWRWQVDEPELIFTGAKEGHYKKIKMMRGVPGVRAERFEEAMRIRHCALSLVGEPIFYPHINKFLDLLHGERISSFLVCNAQHPDQLEALTRVTQLYVSIDASNRDSLKKIDRPLHRDFWERFQKCLDILREKRFVQRTVFRLTLVKGFNIDEEAEGYADLVAKGLPCFVEIKGVTYCGTSTSAGAGLTMANVPWYEEVVEFVEALNASLAKRGLEYGIAAEHAHSCCVLLASKRFHIGGIWNTLIDYNKFFDLLEGGDEFTPEDYCAPTPEWALWGKGGFDPADERVDRKGRKIENADPRRGVPQPKVEDVSF
ncbi:putative flavodoxin and radical sam domain protein [Phaeomoniella chlamydospora]|uniref:S-adenosyl-L-methionine-dependent tRNA 4-demethylwyosine synthase n=1 Tax=Phaeomoniella chlamydospora TaxID=158046 RepID=A0A0G2E2Y0_PHACM|nr:putative flavodoxin and radical sam domain protein [Phaeomoniella chlamydospora]